MAGKAKMLQRSRFNFLQEAQIWYDRSLEERPLSDQFENVIVLSDEFYREITNHPIPTDLEAVKVLAGAPAALDLFMWLSYRCFVTKGREAILLFGERGLASQLGSVEYSRPRRFCQKLEQWLRMIGLLCRTVLRKSTPLAMLSSSAGKGGPGGRRDPSMSRATGRAIKNRRNSVTVHPGQFALENRVRGKPDVLHTAVCRGLEHAIGIGEKWFRASQARNPWLVQDSKRRKIFVLLDPETETLLSS